jgi:hypothetical protein
LEIVTPCGPKDLNPGDWLIRTINGELIVKTGEQFEKEYEPAVKKREPKHFNGLKAPEVPTPQTPIPPKNDKPGGKA